MALPIFHSQYTAAQIEASIGKTPTVNLTNRTWMVWDIETSQYVDTGVPVDTEILIDKTLSLEGAAADAGAVGDKFKLTMLAKGSLSSGDNLNDYKIESGMYYCSASNATEVLNSPFTTAFAVFVKSGTTAGASSGQAQYAISSSGKMACRFYLGGSWGSWSYCATQSDLADKLGPVTTLTAESDINALDFGVYIKGLSTTPVNWPTSITGSCILLDLHSGAQTKTQVFYTNAKFFWRNNAGGSWNSLKEAVTTDTFSEAFADVMQYRGIVGSSVQGPNALTQIGTYYVNANVAGSWNASYGYPVTTAGRLTVIGSSGASTSNLAQFVTSGGSCWFRTCNSSGVWGTWISFASEIEALPEAAFGLFADFAVIGGSYDSGYSYNSAGSGVTNYNYAWGNLVAKSCGNVAHIYAAPGTSIPEWYDPAYDKHARCYEMFAADDPCNLYVCTFGANDDETLGSITDCEAFDANPSITPTTFYGWYAKLIYDIRVKAPDALVIMTTPSSEGIISSWSSKIAAIREIAAHYEIPVIRWMDDTVLNTRLEIYTSVSASDNPHPTPIGHSMLAAAWERLFSRCVHNYPAYFNGYR